MLSFVTHSSVFLTSYFLSSLKHKKVKDDSCCKTSRMTSQSVNTRELWEQLSLRVYKWNEGVSVSGAQTRRGNGQCALSRNNSCLSNTKSPARSKRPLWDNKDPSISLLPLLPSLPSLVAFLWLSLRMKRLNSRITTG